MVGLGNPGQRYTGTRHNIGFEVVAALSQAWEMPRSREKFKGLITDGRAWPGGPQVSLLLPQTFMNVVGTSAGPAMGSMKIGRDRVVVVHDEIDLPFGEVRSKQGGGHAGHNGLRSLIEGLGGKDFWRVRVGVGRPDSTDPEIVSAWVLGRFAESPDQLRELTDDAVRETERLVRMLDEGTDPDGPDTPQEEINPESEETR